MDLGSLGFDFHAVLGAIEERFLSSGPCAVIGDTPEDHVVHALMDEHMLIHGVPIFCEKDGVLVPAPRCPLTPCASAGLAYAAFELRWYAINASDQEKAALFELAAARLPLWGQLAQEFREEQHADVRRCFPARFRCHFREDRIGRWRRPRRSI